MMMCVWYDAIEQACEKRLGRKVSPEDYPRISLLEQPGKLDELGVALDGHQIAWLKGEFVHRDGSTFYQVKQVP